MCKEAHVLFHSFLRAGWLVDGNFFLFSACTSFFFLNIEKEYFLILKEGILSWYCCILGYEKKYSAPTVLSSWEVTDLLSVVLGYQVKSHFYRAQIMCCSLCCHCYSAQFDSVEPVGCWASFYSICLFLRATCLILQLVYSLLHVSQGVTWNNYLKSLYLRKCWLFCSTLALVFTVRCIFLCFPFRVSLWM